MLISSFGWLFRRIVTTFLLLSFCMYFRTLVVRFVFLGEALLIFVLASFGVKSQSSTTFRWEGAVCRFGYVCSEELVIIRLLPPSREESNNITPFSFSFSFQPIVRFVEPLVLISTPLVKTRGRIAVIPVRSPAAVRSVLAVGVVGYVEVSQQQVYDDITLLFAYRRTNSGKTVLKMTLVGGCAWVSHYMSHLKSIWVRN